MDGIVRLWIGSDLACHEIFKGSRNLRNSCLKSVQELKASLKKEIFAMIDAFDSEKLSETVTGIIASLIKCFEGPIDSMTPADTLRTIN